MNLTHISLSIFRSAALIYDGGRAVTVVNKISISLFLLPESFIAV